jgi:uncharacterized protein YdaU (DUF1376 family)
MFYYKFHISDYQAATAHLSNEEDLAYRRLLDLYYSTEAPIPLDTEWVARRLRLGSDTVATVLKDMFQLTDKGWSHHRCEYEIAHYKGRVEANRANGKRGGRRSKASRNRMASDSQPTGGPNLLTNEPIEPIEPTNLTTMETAPQAEQPRAKRGPKKVKVEVSKPEDVTQEVWDGFLALRKARNAPVTSVAIERIRNEAAKVSYSLDSALAMCCARGWQGFHADWTKSREELAKPKSRHDLSGMDYSRGIGPNGEIL